MIVVAKIYPVKVQQERWLMAKGTKHMLKTGL